MPTYFQYAISISGDVAVSKVSTLFLSEDKMLADFLNWIENDGIQFYEFNKNFKTDKTLKSIQDVKTHFKNVISNYCAEVLLLDFIKHEC